METKREKVKKARLSSPGRSAFSYTPCLASRTFLMKAVETKLLGGRNRIRMKWKVCHCGKQENEVNLEGNTIPLLLVTPAKLVTHFLQFLQDLNKVETLHSNKKSFAFLKART